MIYELDYYTFIHDEILYGSNLLLAVGFLVSGVRLKLLSAFYLIVIFIFI